MKWPPWRHVWLSAAGKHVKVGVLALQGDVREHASVLVQLGVEVCLIKHPNHLLDVEAVVLPGGESTTLSMLLDSSRLRDPLTTWVQAGRPTFGTCAGLVMLADRIEDGRVNQHSLGGLGITARRNGFGRQRFSFETSVSIPSLGAAMEAVFIRAPRIISVDEDTEILGTLETPEGPEAVCVRKGNLIGCSFHPELTTDPRLHQLLIEIAHSA